MSDYPVDKHIFSEHMMKWEYNDAAKYAIKLAKVYGYPDYVWPEKKGSPAGACWVNIAGVDKVKVKDESVAHSFPMEHTDFVYSKMKVDKIKSSHVVAFAKVSGSIIIDQLKGMVMARCGKLIKNAVTLQFVMDGIKNPDIITKTEYSKRIKKNSPTIPYKDVLMEYDEEKGEKAMKSAMGDMTEDQKGMFDSMNSLQGGMSVY